MVSSRVVFSMLLINRASICLDALDARRPALVSYGDGALPRRSGEPRHHMSLGLTFQRPFQCLVEGGFGFFVVRGCDLALFLFHFELEQFFLQGFQYHR